MVSMKLDKKKQSELFEKQSYALDDTPEYPYNLKIFLDPDQVAMLGLKDCEVGDIKEMKAKFRVTSREERECEGEEENKVSICIQITDIDCGSKKEKNKTEIMYGE